jgi:hypothetical protein
MRRRLRKKTGGTQKNCVNPWVATHFDGVFLKKWVFSMKRLKREK